MKKIFEYKKLKYRYIKKWGNHWFLGFYSKQSSLKINEGSSSLNYSQQCFEGVKCFKNKKILNFRTNLNSYRFQKSCKFSLIPIINIFNFIRNIKILSILNKKYLPNIKIGFLYIRPLLIGTGKNIGVKTSKMFNFIIYSTPIFFKKKLMCVKSIFSKRTIKNQGHYKIGSNYINNIYNNFIIKKYYFDDYIYIDKFFFEEIGTSNIILIFNKKIYSPLNKNILPGINRITYLFMFKFKKFFLKNNITFFIINNCKYILICGTAANFKFINIILFKNKILKYKINFSFFLINFFFKKINKCLYKIKKWLF